MEAQEEVRLCWEYGGVKAVASYGGISRAGLGSGGGEGAAERDLTESCCPWKLKSLIRRDFIEYALVLPRCSSSPPPKAAPLPGAVRGRAGTGTGTGASTTCRKLPTRRTLWGDAVFLASLFVRA